MKPSLKFQVLSRISMDRAVIRGNVMFAWRDVYFGVCLVCCVFVGWVLLFWAFFGCVSLVWAVLFGWICGGTWFFMFHLQRCKCKLYVTRSFIWNG